MYKIHLDTYSEYLLQQNTELLIKFIPYDLFVRIRQIINKSISQHFIYIAQLLELLNILNEVYNSKKNNITDNIDKNKKLKKLIVYTKNKVQSIVLYNHINFYEIIKYKMLIFLIVKINCRRIIMSNEKNTNSFKDSLKYNVDYSKINSNSNSNSNSQSSAPNDHGEKGGNGRTKGGITR